MYETIFKPFLKDCKTFFLDTLFPVYCLSCGSEGIFVCNACRMQLPRLKDQHCIVCQKPSVLGYTHPGCQTPYAPDGLMSILNYHDETVADILIKGKYSFLPDVYKILGKMLAEKIKADFSHLLKPDTFNLKPALVPIPLSPFRQRWRGFNQAEALCKTLSLELDLPISPALIRRKNTKTQKDLKKDQRIKNIANAFALDLNLKSQILNLPCLLVDDVTTTGSTLSEAAKVLKRNGAAKVWCLTVARD